MGKGLVDKGAGPRLGLSASSCRRSLGLTDSFNLTLLTLSPNPPTLRVNHGNMDLKGETVMRDTNRDLTGMAV